MGRTLGVLRAAWLVGAVLTGCGRDTTTITPSEAPSRGASAARAPGADVSAARGGSAAAAGGSTPALAGSPSGTGSAPSAAVASGGSAGISIRAGAGAGGASTPSPGASAGSGGGPGEGTVQSFRRSAPARVIAIGDLHGDVSAARAALRLGGAIDESDRWIGKDLTVVQTGDELDRGDHEREIVDLFERLKTAAAASGGQVVALNGNHEVMNVQGDFRYVTEGGVSAFGGVQPRSPFAKSVRPPFDERAAAFLPGGAYALVLAQRDLIAVVGDSVFAHGGVLPEHVRYGIDRINRETRAWMSAGGAVPAIVASDGGPIWTRAYSLEPVDASECEMLADVLSALGVRRMVVGHTVQKTGISSACDGRVYRIDVGLSRYYGDGPIQVLEIKRGEVRILSAPRSASPG